MEDVERSNWNKGITYARFIGQQLRNRSHNLKEISPIGPSDVVLNGNEISWTKTGYTAEEGKRFAVRASGALLINKALSLFLQPKSGLWVRIGDKAPVRKVVFDTETVFEAWASGPVEVLAQLTPRWTDKTGNFMPDPRRHHPGGIGVNVCASEKEVTKPSLPEHWEYMSSFGATNIFSGSSNDIDVCTSEGDCCIIKTAVDVPLDRETLVSWSWMVEQLPSNLPEDLSVTHDYISIAFEFDNGRDLTYMWSKDLPAGHHFNCPLPWWCQRETHWVVRSGTNDLGTWHDEKRRLLFDYNRAIPGPNPERIVSIWLIASSFFQRIEGRARFRNIQIEKENGTTPPVQPGSSLICSD
ncbi:DUF3047 domain-containing protein [Gluconobacter morbifer]|uniref:DUF3047 domain-containing protein n=1 Tax=Gluconobacter morbifer G707 TaxID=1088869 RepID=G6XKI5_9PROT|nr:DUF3047 domain-containing protein [Gluconobacter morbifer]EHH67781.1 hypothetical protein GMO_20010 [Gluconobacter morbifer G707]